MAKVKKKKNKKIGSGTKVTVSDIEKLGKESADRKIIVSAVSMILFFSVLIFFSVMTALSDKQTFSELENRSLEDFPKLSAENYFSGGFSDGAEDYLSDHFFGRNALITLKANIDIALGKSERNGIYIVKGKRLAQRVNEPDPEIIGKNLDGINKFAEDNDIPIYFLLAPTSAEIYSDELPKYSPKLDQKNFIDETYNQLNGKIITVDAYSALLLNKDGYIYYRNDHHWTSYGAYLAYTAAAKKMGISATTLNSFDIEHASDSFKGTLYSSSLYNGIEADTIDYFHAKDGCKILGEDVYASFGEEPVHYDDIYFREYLDKKDKYSSFTGQNQPLVTLKSDSPGGKILLIKDSYAHSFAPFLLQNYSEVTMLDLRYIQISYKELIDISDFDAVLFLYNVSSFTTDENLKKLTYK